MDNDISRFVMEYRAQNLDDEQGGNDLRMTKVQQKIFGCFRSLEGAKILCRVRSCLSTCCKHCITATDVLALLFTGKYPNFSTGYSTNKRISSYAQGRFDML